MKRWNLFFILFFTLSGCFDNNEFSSVLETDPLSQEGEIFISESGEEYWMGCNNSYCYGFAGATPDSEKTLTNLVIPAGLPTSFDLSAFLPEVGDQGRLGSCTAWATAYYGRSLLFNFSENSYRTQSVRLSPSFIYNQITQGECKATSIVRSMQLLVDEGASEWDVFPYQSTGCDRQPDSNQRENASAYKMGDFKLLSGINLKDEIKTLLTQGNPVVVAMSLDPEFGKKDSFGLSAYRPHQVDTKRIFGSHAMLIVGYSDHYEAFKLVNSWGESWGDNGFVWVDYKAFDQVFEVNNPFRVLCQALVGLN